MIKGLGEKVDEHPIRVPFILNAFLVVKTPHDMLIVGPDVGDKVVAEDVEVFLQTGQAQPGRREEVDDVMPFHDIDLSGDGSYQLPQTQR